MFSVTSLTDDQKTAIHQWAAEGAQIADIQKKLDEEFSINITYMDARFLVLDLGVTILSEQKEEPVEEEKPEKIATGKVHVTIDTIVRAGAEMSGSVEFCDGERAVWSVDSMGRLSLDADEPGYRPNELDLQLFQDELREQLQGKQ